MGRGRTGLGGRVLGAWLTAVLTVVAAQSAAHLELALGQRRSDTILDLDRSNGLPDLVSTLVLALAAAGAVVVAYRQSGVRRGVTATLGGLITLLAAADLAHKGAHPSGAHGETVIALALATGVLLVPVAATGEWPARGLLSVAAVALTGSFLAGGLDRFDERFDGEGGDPIAEYEIVAKEGLELVGWSLVALALWDEALRLPSTPMSGAATAPASRARAASRRRAA